MEDLPAATAHTMEQTQRARHDAGISSAVHLDFSQVATAVAGTSATSSSAIRTAPPSATHLSLAAAKEHLAEAAGVALRKALIVLEEAIVACNNTPWLGQFQAVTSLQEAYRLLAREEPGTRPAAQAYDRLDDARKLDSIPEDAAAVLKAAARGVRDVLVLRCCWLVDHRSRDAFLHELATAFQRPIKGELESQLLHAYNTLTSSEHGYDVPDAFTSRNQLHRTRRPRKKGPVGSAEGFVQAPSGAASSGWHGAAQAAAQVDQDEIAERCAESVLSMEPMKVELRSGEPGGNAPPAPLGFTGSNSAALDHQFSASSSSSAAPGALLVTGAPFGAAATAQWPGAVAQCTSGHAQGGWNTASAGLGHNTTFGGWQGWHQQAWCGEAHSSDADWQAHAQDQWPGAASASRPYHSFPGGPGGRTRL
jgi:hypothetical protein